MLILHFNRAVVSKHFQVLYKRDMLSFFSETQMIYTYMRRLSLYLLFFIYSEYYFSQHNLESDFFMRRNMDKDGWVPISLIKEFPKVVKLAQDINLIIQVSLLIIFD